MPQEQGANAYVVIDKETAYDTPKTENQSAWRIPILSCDVGDNTGLKESEELTGDRNPTEPYLDNADISGKLDLALRADSMGLILHHGVDSSPDLVDLGSGLFKRTFKVRHESLNILDSFVLGKSFRRTGYHEHFSGCKINSIEMGVAPGGELKASCAILGSRKRAGQYDETPTLLSGTKMMMKHVSAKEGGAAIKNMKEMKLTFGNNLDPDSFAVGLEGARFDLVEGRVSLTGTLTAYFSDTTLLAKATGTTKSSLQIDIAPSASEKLSIIIPELVYKPLSPPIQGPKGITLDLSFQAFYQNNAQGSAIIFELTNTVAQYYAA